MVSANVDTAPAGIGRCTSCDAPLAGQYCSRCGERVLEPDALTLRHFLVHTVAHELLHVDSTLWRTLRLLVVRPGELSREIDRYGILRGQMAAKAAKLQTDEARERFHDRMAAFAQPASFANVFLLAAALHLVFRRTSRRFLEHAAFSMHVVSFVLLSSGLQFFAIGVRSWLGGYVFLALLLVVVLQFAYLAVAIRRFYLPSGRWGSRLLSVAAAVFIYVLNTVFMTAVQVAGAAIALALT